MSNLLALWQQPIHNWGIADILTLVLVIAGCLGITFVVLRVCGITIPPWVWHIILIVAAVFLGILAIRFLASL